MAADRLHVLDEEFAQAILFKKKELMAQNAVEIERMIDAEEFEKVKAKKLEIEENAAR